MKSWVNGCINTKWSLRTTWPYRWVYCLDSFFDFVSVLSQYIATYDIHSFLLPSLVFHVFFLYQCIHCINIIFRHEQISCRIGDWILLQRDPLIGGILFGNNNKIDEFFILFYESIFLFLESFSCKKLKLISLFFFIAKSLLVWKSLWKSETWVLMHLNCWDFQNANFKRDPYFMKIS